MEVATRKLVDMRLAARIGSSTIAGSYPRNGAGGVGTLPEVTFAPSDSSLKWRRSSSGHVDG